MKGKLVIRQLRINQLTQGQPITKSKSIRPTLITIIIIVVTVMAEADQHTRFYKNSQMIEMYGKMLQKEIGIIS